MATLAARAGLLLALAAAAATVAAGGHTCVHDEVVARHVAANFSAPRHLVEYGENGRRRALSGGQTTTPNYAPIRIKPIYIDNAISLPSGVSLEYFKTNIVQAAVANWQSLLSVVPVSGNLFASRECSSTFGSAPLKNMCAGYRSPSASYFCGYSSTAAGSDYPIPYGSYVGNQDYYTGSCTPGGDINTCAKATETAGTGPGVADADFVIFVTVWQTDSCPKAAGESGTLAYASTCQRDQFDRPTWGRVNFCPLALSAKPADLQLQINVATHEVNHALGFSSSSWALWRKPDTTPRTLRDPVLGTPATTFSYTCGSKARSAPVVDPGTVAFFAERGMSKCEQLASSASTTAFDLSNCVHRIVTPTVVAATLAHFGCTDASLLPGAELENHLTTPCGSMGSHWEQRVHTTELMSSYVQHTSIVSAMTLALHEDSGWYKANYEAVLPVVMGVTLRNKWRKGDWGFGQGCAFAKNPCLAKGTTPPTPLTATPPHFYGTSVTQTNTGLSNLVCSTDLAYYGQVQIDQNDQNTQVQRINDIASQYRYFSDAKTGGGLDAADYCPVAESFSSSVCSTSTQPADSSNYAGETFGKNSACFISSLIDSGVGISRANGAICAPFSCSQDGKSVTITLTRHNENFSSLLATPTTATVNCGPNDGGKTISGSTITGFSGTIGSSNQPGTITCPDPAILCATPAFVTPCPAGQTLNSAGACVGACPDGSARYGGASAPCTVVTPTATSSATSSATSTMSASSSSSATASATSTSSATQTAVPQLPVASASASAPPGTVAVYGALSFSGPAGAAIDVTTLASAGAVAALADSITAAVVASIATAAIAAGANNAAAATAAVSVNVSVTIISIKDMATGLDIYKVASAGARRLAGAPGSQGVVVDFSVAVPAASAGTSGGAAAAAAITAAVSAPASGAASASASSFATAVAAFAATSSNAGLSAGFASVTAAVAAPTRPSASPKALAAATIEGVPIGAAVGGAVAAFVVAIVAGVVARIVLRRMRAHSSGKVAPGGGEETASAAAAAAPSRATRGGARPTGSAV